jgi:hypothetical protein
MRRSTHAHKREARHSTLHRDGDAASDPDSRRGQRGDDGPGRARLAVAEEEVGRGVELAVEVIRRAASTEASAAAEDRPVGHEEANGVVGAGSVVGSHLDELGTKSSTT